MTDTAPITEGAYPPRPITDALTDEAKQALVEQGYAEGEGAGWRLTDAAALPGYPVPTDTPAARAPSHARLEDQTAAELVSLLRDNPGMAGPVEAAERRRDEPRSTVLDAVERARG